MGGSMNIQRIKERLQKRFWELQGVSKPKDCEVVHALKEVSEHASSSVQVYVSDGAGLLHQNEQNEIVAALERIENGKFGICEKCPELISEVRLDAHPYAKKCLACEIDDPEPSIIKVAWEKRSLRNPYHREFSQPPLRAHTPWGK